MLPNNLTKEHYEIDEDGNRHFHPGYIEKTCVKCGGRFIVSKSMSDREVCGKEGNHDKGGLV